MKKLSSAICLVMLLTLVTIPVQAEKNNTTQVEITRKHFYELRVRVDGNRVTKGGYPFTDEMGTLYLPLRATAEAMGKTVTWDNSTKSIIIEDISLKLGSTTLTTPTSNIDLGASIVSFKGESFAPVTLFEYLGAFIKISYSNTFSSVMVYSDGGGDKNPANFEKLKTTRKGDLLVHTGDVYAPTYASVHGSIDMDGNQIGFTDIKLTKEKDSSLAEDIAYLNEKLLNKTGYKLNNLGQLVSASDSSEGYRESSFSIQRNHKNEKVIEVFQWGTNDDQAFTDIQVRNLTAEALKYYVGLSDAKKIYAYLDNAFNTKQACDEDQIHQFGSTYVQFNDPGVYGIEIIILDDTKSAK